MGWWEYKKYVPVAQRLAKGAREAARRAKKSGRTLVPIKIEGRNIATSFWGKSWCENLESYSDYSNRLPRGRTYARNGSIVDLQITGGHITALVCGSSLYEVKIEIKSLAPAVWNEVKSKSAGQIGSLVELIQGRLSKSVMEIVTRQDSGLFPKPSEIRMSCSCPDGAGMCKHLAATMYGVGARLDAKPELLFVMRQVDHLELIEGAGKAITAAKPRSQRRPVIADDELASVFDIEMSVTTPMEPTITPPPEKSGRTRTTSEEIVKRTRAKVREKTKSSAKSNGSAVMRKVATKTPAPRTRRPKSEIDPRESDLVGMVTGASPSVTKVASKSGRRKASPSRRKKKST